MAVEELSFVSVIRPEVQPLNLSFFCFCCLVADDIFEGGYLPCILGFAPKFIVRVVDEIQLLTLLYDLLLFTSLS